MADSEAAADVERTAVAKQRVRQPGKQRSKLKNQDRTPAAKRRCVSTACIACRKRKSKCDGNTPSCAACSSVYHTPCIYDPNSDHRRKGVYKQDIDNLKNRNTTLQTLVEAILNYDEDDVLDLVRQMRSSDDLEAVAESILTRQSKKDGSKSELPSRSDEDIAAFGVPQFESELAGRISELKLDGTVKYVGGTSNLIFLPASSDSDDSDPCLPGLSSAEPLDDSIRCWTTVTKSKELIRHLLTMYFTWHYPYFTTLSKRLFYRDFVRGRPSEYCSALLVNAMLALGCHFSSWPATREDPNDSATAGDHFFREAKRLILEHDEHEKARLCNVQAFAIMSVREAGCGREGSGWVYSGMSFRMAYDLGLNVDATGIGSNRLNDQDIDARRITFWGCYLFDKCWSNYLGRQPQLSGAQITVPKVDVFPDEDSEMWSPYTDVGVSQEHVQPARTRAVALQISKLCEISSDLLSSFYNPIPVNRHMGKQEELRRLSQLHTRLEAWRKDLPKEMEPKDGQLPQVLLMHMFFQLLFIHLYRPFLKYTKATSPLPQHVSPRKLCTQSASMISKLLRIYKRSYNLRQICNVAVYIVHSACTIHLLNLPDKASRRDIVYGLKNLEEMAESWLCARRTLRILDLSAQKWHIALPAEATAILERSHAKFGSWASWDQVHSSSTSDESTKMPSQEAPSIPSTRGSSPDENLKSVQAHPQPAGTPLQAMPQFAQAFRPVSQKSAIHPSQSVKDFQCNPSLPEPPPKPSCYTDVDIQPKLEDSGSPPILTVTDTSSTSLEAPQIPAFAEIDNLVEESQDWWFKDQNALALGLDNWDWGSPDGACGDIDVERTMPPTSTPTPSFGENPHLIPGQVTGVISPNIGVHTAPHAYSGGYYVPESTPDSINVTQAFTGPPSEPGIHTPNQMYY
ncbi:hypothetical protein D8B26_007617 [Coccidioides posadasii str. Silveira]|uniref:Nitrogen assimilation transcription factor nirA n=2 Tax=Coccidioides posadasii TaxID=199306 RepID=E9D2G9_COCPS|nr:nitrogen assimilation transcription factor nirA, putative [Coccidioides posadasii C735 delta SOWgp]EER25027.1 nitrogen assimilation transcription factor nirA, putative [Coccidioides posadasii C735 delta SOWgp]EFW19383.1 nitrogen assimilation transcription factor nirA [Coccidioides posadasii str. Silveira]QVM13000.1 hypothetical protein D8B26_007617 [Coccidioides posadasii str. Silveira]|eukprot:XP_003067172.1 nitrogen assimilation transcription factor nirA, putative [Coccidioides posadasii C735 delta SOWgp]